MFRFKKFRFFLASLLFGLIGVFGSLSDLEAEEMGQGWSPSQKIIKGNDILQGSFAIDQQGNWHIVYFESNYDASGKYYYYIKYINKTSLEPSIIASAVYDVGVEPDAGESISPTSFVIDQDGGLHVMYTYVLTGGGAKEYRYTYKPGPTKLFTVIPGAGFGKVPEHGDKMIERAKEIEKLGRFRYDDTSSVRICEADRGQTCNKINPSDEQVRSTIKEATKNAEEQEKDLVVDIDMDLERFSRKEYINPFSKRWQRSVKWAGKMTNLVSEAFNEENPSGFRRLYAHSAGVDAAKSSIEQMPGKIMYDDLNLFNGRAKVTLLKNALLKSGYKWWKVKVFTSKNDLPAFPGSLSYYSSARQWTGNAWMHLHSLSIPKHSGLIETVGEKGGTKGTFKANLGEYKMVEGTVEDMMLKNWIQ